MKALTILVISIFFTFPANGRLIDKNTEKTGETRPTEPTTPVRVSRQAFYEDPIGVSREVLAQPQDDFRPYVRRGRYSIRSKPSDAKETKVAKENSDVTASIKKEPVESEEAKSTTTLIKKPIPKFNEVDYEDFQGKVNKAPVKFADSGEHEDEDFNLDDYEFDVNHDEFVGRGKPLEPRTKVKDSKRNPVRKTPKIRPTPLTPPEIKTQSKVIIPTDGHVRTKNGIPQKVADKMKEDYYDDIITTTKATELEIKRDSEDEFPDDTDDSKEFNSKNPVRIVRSPWFVKQLASKMGDKGANILEKVVNALPPMLLQDTLTFSNSRDGVSDFANDPMIDPLTGTRFIY